MKKQELGVRDKGLVKKREILTVQILEAKPNPMFTEEQRAVVRFPGIERRQRTVARRIRLG